MTLTVVTDVDGVDWPDDCPPPRVGDDVDTGTRWYTVTGVVWKVLGEFSDDPSVLIQLEEV